MNAHVEIPAAGTEERHFWLEAAQQHGFDFSDDEWFSVPTEDQLIALMAAARQQGRDDVLSQTAPTLSDLHAANIARQAEWCVGGDPEPDLAFRGNELAGETGEACNVIKKLERERHGWRGSRATLDDLAQELADVVICADLCAITAGIDLAAAVVAKFNATSEKVGLTTRLLSPSPATPYHPISTARTEEAGNA